MNSSVINSSQPFYHSSSAASLQLLNTYTECISSLGEYWFEFIVRVINCVLGYPANIMVMWLVSKKNSDFSTSDIFIFNLAIADACYCLMAPISYAGYQMLGITYMWDFLTFSYGIKDTTSLFLTCICLDRYVAVVHPIVFTSIKDNKIRVSISMLVWGLMLAHALSRTLQLDVSNIFLGLILTIFSIMAFCNVSIMWSLRKSVLSKEKIHPMKKKALRTVLITLTIIVFNYLPVVAVMPLRHYGDFPETCQIEVIAFALMDISASIEPLIYISKMEQLPCRNNLPCICCRKPSNKPHNVSA